MSKYRELFLSEAREHLTRMGQLLVSLEQAPERRETIDALFREAHSVKGMAASMGYERTATLAHHLEDALDGFRRGGGVPSAAVDRLLAGLDLLEGLLEDLQADRTERDIDAFLRAPAVSRPIPAADPSAGPEIAAASSGATVSPASVPDTGGIAAPGPAGTIFQVTVELADDTVAAAARGLLIVRELERAGDILSLAPGKEQLRLGGGCPRVQAWLRTAVPRARLEAALLAMADVRAVSFVDDRRNEGGRRAGEGGRSVRVRTDLLDEVVNLTGELLTRRFMLQRAAALRDWNALDDVLGEAVRLVEGLHHSALQARLMPLENIAGRFPRLVRDQARAGGKDVTFRLVGGAVGLDRLILEELVDPLVHLVRNAIDHGIAERGEVTVSARREKDLVLIEVSDNGRGMDPARLRRQAVACGVLSAEQAEALSDREALMLVCVPGFSTAREVTETSGRGVGMDVVKAAVEKLGGTLEIHSVPGQGSAFQMRLPQSMAIIRILLVSCGEQVVALPVTRIQRTLELPAAAVVRAGSRRVFHLDDEAVDLVRLGDLLAIPGAAAGDPLAVVLADLPGRRIGLQVDGILGQREAFVKALGFPFDRLPGLSGATVEADGRIVFIVDPHPLFVAGEPAPSAEETAHALS